MTASAPALEQRRSSRPSRFDVVLAGVVLVAQVGFTVLAASHQPERRGIDALAVALLAAGPVALVWRRRFPIPVYGVSFAATLAYSLIGYGRGPIFFSLIVAFVTVVNAGHRAVAWISIVVGYFAFEWADTWFGHEPAPGWPGALGLAAWLIVLATVTEIVHVRRERAAEIAHSAREEQLRRASDERLRIARDLHDVVAHNISLINVQASVALHLVDEQPERAGAALRAIKDASKDALEELRSVLDILRAGDEAPRAPTPTLDDVDQLIERAAATGLDVVIDVQGVRRRLPQPVEVAAYRVVQEALTNVVRHAGSAPTIVSLSYSPESIVVQVDDNGTGSPPNGTASGTTGTGSGLLGMRERVAALGGRLDAAARPSGGFRVRAWIPVGHGP
jgi:signal transduction histidine kinase